MSKFVPKGKKDIKAEIGILEDYIEKLEEDIRKFSETMSTSLKLSILKEIWKS